MTKYLITFPASAMRVPAEELPAVSAASHAVIREAKAAGVYVFGGGLHAGVPAVRVAADGAVSPDTYPQTAQLDGGLCVLELPSRDAALQWAAKLAAACSCAQELREFHFDPES